MTAEIQAGWRALLHGRQGLYCLTLTAGIVLYAVILPISYTVLPAIIRELHAELYYSWIAAVFTLGSFLGACLLSRGLRLMKPHIAYVSALSIFALCTLACAYAPSLLFLLPARMVQGLSGGFLVALTYIMLNTALPAELLPRGIGLISGMWGIATLIGPYLGGRFDNWRIPFFTVSAFTLLFCLFIFFIFGKLWREQHRQQYYMPAVAPLPPILILAVLILIISLGSVPQALQQLLNTIPGKFGVSVHFTISSFTANAGALISGFFLIMLLAFVEKRSKNRLLPAGTFSAGSVFSPVYTIIILNMVALGGAKLYLPLFLRDLHQTGPISAGYIAFTDSIGWSVGALVGATLNATRGDKGESRFGRIIVFILAPLLCIIGMGGMLLLILVPSHSGAIPLLIGLSFFIAGFFSGIIWPHILASVLQNAGKSEKEAAGSSLVTTQLFAAALADCLAGAIVNATGFRAEDTASLSHAATVLFTFCLILLIAVFFLCLKIKNYRQG